MPKPRPALILLLFSVFCFAQTMAPIPGQAFTMDRHEVRNADYQKCVAAGACNPAHYTDSLGHCYDGKEWPQQIIPESYRAPEMPVVCVDWFEAKKYCEWAGKRLPTEKEWEVSARAGSSTTFYWGDLLDTAYLWYRVNSGLAGHATGLKKPNALGLYDMCGNVWEWCEDWSDSTKVKKVFRGGSWVSDSNAVTCAARKGAPPESRYCNNGFRCVVDRPLKR